MMSDTLVSLYNMFIPFKEQKWPQEDVSNARNKGRNYFLILHRKRTNKIDIKWSLP